MAAKCFLTNILRLRELRAKNRMASRNKDRIKPLYLDSNGVGSQIVFFDTVLRGAFKCKDCDMPGATSSIEKTNLLFSGLRDVDAKRS